jgi:hypothetical protein
VQAGGGSQGLFDGTRHTRVGCSGSSPTWGSSAVPPLRSSWASAMRPGEAYSDSRRTRSSYHSRHLGAFGSVWRSDCRFESAGCDAASVRTAVDCCCALFCGRSAAALWRATSFSGGGVRPTHLGSTRRSTASLVARSTATMTSCLQEGRSGLRRQRIIACSRRAARRLLQPGAVSWQGVLRECACS